MFYSHVGLGSFLVISQNIKICCIDLDYLFCLRHFFLSPPVSYSEAWFQIRTLKKKKKAKKLILGLFSKCMHHTSYKENSNDFRYLFDTSRPKWQNKLLSGMNFPATSSKSTKDHLGIGV